MEAIAASRETTGRAEGLQSLGFVRELLLAVCPLVTAILLSICLTSSRGVACCWVALVPWGLALTARQVPRATCAAAYLAGLVVHLAGMAWLLDCYRYESRWGPYLFEWFWIGSYGGALLACTLLVGRLIRQRLCVPMMLLLPCLWTAFEFVRQELATGMIGIAFPWLKLGTALTHYPRLLQSADLGGEFLLTFFIAFINGAIVDIARPLWRRSERTLPRLAIQTTAVVAVVLAAIGYGQWRLQQHPFTDGPNVCLLGELDLPPILPEERLQVGLAENSVHADLLLWPELAYHHPIVDSETDGTAVGRRHLETTARRLHATLVIGCEHMADIDDESARYNSVACVDSQRGLLGCYDKRCLVPSVEADGDTAYQRGESSGVFPVVTSEGVYHFGVAICYDLCFSEHFRQLRGERQVDFYVQCGAEGQDRNDVVADWMLRYARLRAVESRRPIVRNATLGYSGLIDGNGTVRRVLPATPIERPTWLGTIPVENRGSFYAVVGDWVGGLSLVAITLLFGEAARRQLAQG